MSTNTPHTIREDWLTAALAEMRVSFQILNRPLPAKIRLACGFPLHAARGRVGECWSAESSGDKTVEILISPVISDPAEVFSLVIHELIHASGIKGHGVKFASIASQLGLLPSTEKGWAGTTFDASFESKYADMLAELGPYPHAQLAVSRESKTQQTRMLKLICQGCNPSYIVRTTAIHIAKGLPTCSICGTSFVQSV